MTRTDTSNGALTRSAGVCRKRIPKRDTHSCRPRLTGLPYVPGPMLFPSPEAPARVVAPSALRPARRSQRATLGLVGPTRVEGLNELLGRYGAGQAHLPVMLRHL